jgi:hypothetical protein
MVANLCRMFGEPCDGDSFTFPTPERLAAVPEDDLKEAKLGFRARYISEFARRVDGGDLDLDAWCGEPDPDALRTALLGIKGVGSYGANHLLMLLGITARSPATARCGSTWAYRRRRDRKRSSGWRRSGTDIGDGTVIWRTSSSGCSGSGTMWIGGTAGGGEGATSRDRFTVRCDRKSLS